MKKIILNVYFISCLLLSSFATAQFPCQLSDSIYWTNVPGAGMGYTNVEIRIFNQTLYHTREIADSIRIRIIPVGFFFNGDNKYSRKAKVRIQPDSNITGIELIIPAQNNSNDPPSYRSGNWDQSNGNTFESQFSFGFGKYKIEFYKK